MAEILVGSQDRCPVVLGAGHDHDLSVLLVFSLLKGKSSRLVPGCHGIDRGVVEVGLLDPDVDLGRRLWPAVAGRVLSDLLIAFSNDAPLKSRVLLFKPFCSR